jgi:chemotaxis protein MotA
MDLATVIGLTIALIGIIGGKILEGGDPIKLLNLPGFFIVIVGSLGAVMISQPLSVTLGLPKFILKAFLNSASHNSVQTVELFVRMADKARREGLLALEADVEKIHDPFTRKGVQLMIDGTDPELLREIMEIERESMRHRHEGNFAALEFLGAISPTLGVLGAVMGLMTVMTFLDQPDRIGPGIATAFVATFYGVFTANIIWLPLASKLKSNSKHELHALDVVIEGLMSIQAGDNPRIVREKLEGFLQPSARGKNEKEEQVQARREAA